MATYSGQVVKWDEAISKGPDESPERIAWDAVPRHLPGPDGRYPLAMPGVYRAYPTQPGATPAAGKEGKKKGKK
jgi:hypothetical protein